MDCRLTPEQDLLRAAVREFAEREIRPNVMAWDEAAGFPHELVTKMAGLGLMGIQYPERLGGAAMSALDYCIAIEELARVCSAVALSVAAHNGLCSAHLYMFGTAEQQATYLVPLIRGDYLGAWGLTEPGAGSDAGAMRTTAVRDGDGWVLNGAKQFITHGSVGGVIVAMAVTDRRKESKGISAFVIPRGTPGMRAGRTEHKLGMRASDTSEVLFEQCRVGPEALVGVEGQGFINTLQVLDAGRIGIAALSVGLAQGAYDAALRYAQERRQFGQPIAAFQAIRWKLADLAVKIEAARLLTYRAAVMKDEGAPRTSLESSIAKLYASEVAVRAAEEGVQIHGGYGFVKDYPAEKYFRDVKLCTIGEGTSEIQRLVIARQLLAAAPAVATA